MSTRNKRGWFRWLMPSAASVVAGGMLAFTFQAAPVAAAAPAKKGFKIALSNSFAGDSWRQEMLAIAKAYAAEKQKTGEISQFYESSSGNDPQAQINQIRNLMSQGYNAILVDAASSTALIPVLNQAVQRGIVVVAFDNTVDSPQVYNVNTDQVKFGALQAQWLMKKIGGKGNILIINGIDGIPINADRYKGYQNVLAKYPKVKVLQQGFGNYNEATTSVVINNMLSAVRGQKIAGILTQGGGEAAIYQALKQHNLNPAKIPMTGEMMNGFFRIMKQGHVQGFAAGQPPYLSAAALDVALKVLEGKKVPKTTLIPLPTATNQDIARWYAPGQSDDFYVDWTDAKNTYHLKLSDIVKK
ncbi:MAG: substrate-binding domain-containing protein [Alicyclobacillus sp.]|nr:substrate-binding domain-containing protein [Alicyclobacillus sp.]